MINRLTDIYERWTTVNELPAQSADEHDRDKLTEEQIKWLNEFSEHWHNQVDIDHFIDDNTPKFFELPKNTIIKFGEYEHNVLNGSIDVSNEKGTVAANQAKLLNDWLTDNLTTADKQALAGEKPTGNKAP